MLAYVDAIVRENTITVDGYTTNKTERGIIKDAARAIEKYDEETDEAEYKEGYHNYFCIRFVRKQTKINDST